jgi:two-component system response regulator FlrC
VLGAGQAIVACEKAEKVLAFLDTNSKQYDALDLMRKILSRQPEASVVVTAEQPSVDLAVESIKEGAWDFLVRPIEPDKLGLVIGQTLGRTDEEPPLAIDKKSGAEPWKIITDDPEFKRVLSIAERAASGQASVFIQGESGTGKEMLARFVHMQSPRRDKPFVAVNCAALPESLLESELFGHEKGAFTGAISRRLGKFEMADGGTILLDEISEMQIHLQAKLLRVLQEQVIDRVGGSSPVQVDVRVISTTNRVFPKHIEEGNFREDLYYRLNVIPLQIPPLRTRKGDLPILLEHFIKKHNKRNNKQINKISNDIHDILARLPWKGNVREFENVIERAVVLAPENELLVEHLLLDEQLQDSPLEMHDGGTGFDPLVGLTVQEVERRLIVSTLGKVSENRTRAAEMLGISIRTLRNKLKEYGTRTKVT